MPEPTILVDAGSGEPAYRQIVDQVRLHLNAGALAQGDRLPSVRSLAAQLGVHFNTVADAYRELADEGWIELAAGRRATVLARGRAPALPKEEAAVLRLRLRHLLAEMLLKGISPRTIIRDFTGVLEA